MTEFFPSDDGTGVKNRHEDLAMTKNDWMHVGAIIVVTLLGLFVIDFKHFSLFGLLIIIAITVLIGSEIMDLVKRFKK